jgi:hypothetical protein
MAVNTLENLDELSINSEDRGSVEPFFRDKFSRIRVRDFNFQTGFWEDSLPLLEENDILIHKKFEKESRSASGKLRPPRVIYYIYMDGELLRLEYGAKDQQYTIKNHIKKQMINYICEKNEFPYMTTLFEITLKKKITLHYEPTEYDKFSIDLEPITDINVDDSVDKTVDYLRALKTNMYNEFRPEVKEKVSKNIDKINNPYLENLSGFKDKTTIYVKNATVMAKELRRQMYMEHETYFYMVRIANFKAWTDFNPTGVDIKEINIRLSTNVVDKYNLEVGDIIYFKGQYSSESRKGTIIQNIKAIEKTGKVAINGVDALIKQYEIDVNGNLYNVPMFYFDYGNVNVDAFMVLNTEKQKEMRLDVRFGVDDKTETITHIFHFKEKQSLENMLKYVPTIKEQHSKAYETYKNELSIEKDYAKNFKIIEKNVCEPIDELMDL